MMRETALSLIGFSLKSVMLKEHDVDNLLASMVWRICESRLGYKIKCEQRDIEYLRMHLVSHEMDKALGRNGDPSIYMPLHTVCEAYRWNVGTVT